MTRRSLTRTSVLLCALIVPGCGAKQAALPYAVYANEVPIYPGAVLEDAMGSARAADGRESVSDGMAWFFKVQAPAEKLVAFYERRLPGALRDPRWHEGVRLVWVPRGAAPGERVEVIVAENELRISESVQPGKRPGDPNETSQAVASDLSGSGGGSNDGN